MTCHQQHILWPLRRGVELSLNFFTAVKVGFSKPLRQRALPPELHGAELLFSKRPRHIQEITLFPPLLNL